MQVNHFYEAEDRNGIRFTWNVWPSTVVDCKKLICPLACMYTPYKKIPNMKTSQDDPTYCSNCNVILNPYCYVDVNGAFWTCLFCSYKNKFQPRYQGQNPASIIELQSDATTMEYVLKGPDAHPPALLFVVDISLSESELEYLKSSLLQCITLLPPTTFVGLITYGQQVNLYELNFTSFPKVHVFDTSTDWTRDSVQKSLDLNISTMTTGPVANRFILPVSKIEDTLNSFIEDLFPDPRVTKPDHRKHRVTGSAIQVALNLLELTFNRSPARVLIFGGGPATLGQGTVVGEEIKEGMRSHTELSQEKAPHVFKANKFYTTLAEQAAKNYHVVDIFSCSLDQTGMFEMRDLPKMSGGIMVTAESFQHEQFKRSLIKLFETDEEGYLKMAFNPRIEIKVSKEVGICGAIGHVTSAFNKNGNFIDPEVGIGHTAEWKSGVFDQSSTIAFFFELTSDLKSNTLPGVANYGVLQFRTKYSHPNGKRILRVTTVAHNWLAPNSLPTQCLVGFDQEASAAIYSRLSLYKQETEDINITKYIDGILIKFSRRYAVYQSNNPSSLQFPSQIGLFPQFMFHFRRSSLVNVFGTSPDETSFFRHYALREPVANILIMIQPSLDSYAIEREEPIPVLLSASSLTPEVVLVLDTFFHVVVWIGKTIASWRDAGYHKQEEYINLKTLLEVPVEDAKTNLVKTRFPVPLYVEAVQNTSPARYVTAVVDPGQTTAFGQQPGETVNTEDASLSKFLEQLQKYAVQPE